MQSPLKESQTYLQPGWTGVKRHDDAPRTVERKRKGRGVDVISSLPTPPSQQMSHLPTPETVRRKADSHPHASSSTQLPTPQTQRTRRRAPPPSSSELEAEPSPSGHTTFFLSSAAASSSSITRPEKVRRRPGLTFAQQMGLISSSNTSVSGSKGIGVGIGGHKNAGHVKVDQIGSNVSLPTIDENPFLVSSALGAPVGLASPGAITDHQPTEPDSDSDAEGAPMLCSPSRPRRSPRLASPSPSANITKSVLPSSAATGLLSPPPTKHAPRIGIVGANGTKKPVTREEKVARERASREAEERRRMLDLEDNPFLVKPGEPSTRRPGPIIDEDLPTVTYVFRGAKKVFANPLYPSRAPFPQAELDPEEDEFEPHPLPKPKLLWPSGPSPSKRINLEAARTPSPDPEISPPSSPVATPTISRRFGREALQGESLQLKNDPSSIFSDDEGEVIMRNARGHGHGNEHEHEHEEEEMHIPSRRGLLFGGAFAGGLHGQKGVKRSIGDSSTGQGHGHAQGGEESRAKKAKGLLRL
ncbi:hypothetical protein I317_05509 [Kwoniella heveanensis CBS 569]|nr:hypothetical protein I317_05509 [Kwoniella heveanensis CBS 569]